MPRATLGSGLTLLLLPASWLLLMAGTGLPHHAYTGVVPRPDRTLAVVEPGSPGEMAGLAPGDRLAPLEATTALARLDPDPLAHARPGVPMALVRERAGVKSVVWIVPRPLPDAEHRFHLVQYAVAAAFLLLGGWVWGERRDTLTRTFFLLCTAFSVFLAPPPSLDSTAAMLLYQFAFIVAQLFLGPLFSHFFALFPESGRPRARAWVLPGYAAATLLLACFAGVFLEAIAGSGRAQVLLPLLQMAPGIVFSAGILGGLVLFGIAFARAETSDARRRLRVAFVGTLLGVLPFALLVALHNLSHAPNLPGERWAVPFLVLVPVSFAWAMVVHNVFDSRVALRAFMRALFALAAAAALYSLGEWLAASWWPTLGRGVAGAALAMVALLAALAGPAQGWLRAAGRRLVPIADDEWTLGEWAPGEGDEPQLLLEACESVAHALRADGAAALRISEGGAVAAGAGAALAPLLSPAAAEALRHTSGPQEPGALPFSHEDRDALEQAGVRWLVPVNARLALAVGRRFSGTWLSRAEARALERLARTLAVALENLELRQQARGAGMLAREMREASAVQARRLPRHTPVHPTLDCAAITLATEAVGGDYYDFVEAGGREFTLAVGDAAGHGMAAALVLAGVQARFRDEAQRARHPGELLEAMNRDLVALEQPEHFMGLVCARVDAATGTVRLANAGLTPPLLRRRDGRRVTLEDSGLLLGVQAGSQYPVVSAELEPGDVLVVYTDGLSEASREGRMFGEGPLWEVLDRHAHRRAADLVDELLAAVRAWADTPLDDLTVVVLKQLARARSRST